jgi:putative transposase
MINPNHPRLSIVRQCALVRIARSSHYHTGRGESPLNLDLMRLIDEQYMSTPWYGTRQMSVIATIEPFQDRPNRATS